MMAVIPNRRDVWTRTDNTPFGHGRPYSRSQITQLLRQTWFTPIGWGEALFVPPLAAGWFLRSAAAWERVGASDLDALCRRPHRGSDQTGLPRYPCPPRTARA